MPLYVQSCTLIFFFNCIAHTYSHAPPRTKLYFDFFFSIAQHIHTAMPLYVQSCTLIFFFQLHSTYTVAPPRTKLHARSKGVLAFAQASMLLYVQNCTWKIFRSRSTNASAMPEHKAPPIDARVHGRTLARLNVRASAADVVLCPSAFSGRPGLQRQRPEIRPSSVRANPSDR